MWGAEVASRTEVHWLDCIISLKASASSNVFRQMARFVTGHPSHAKAELTRFLPGGGVASSTPGEACCRPPMSVKSKQALIHNIALSSGFHPWRGRIGLASPSKMMQERSVGIPIKDEFTDLPVLRQRKYQLRMAQEKRCQLVANRR